MVRLPEVAGLAIGVEPQVAAAGAPIAAFGRGLALASEKSEPAFADAVLPSAVVAARLAAVAASIGHRLPTPGGPVDCRRPRAGSKMQIQYLENCRQQARMQINIVFYALIGFARQTKASVWN